MALTTARIRRHHESISEDLRTLSETIDDLTEAGVEGVRDKLEGFVDFFVNDLKPHAEGEEKALYPAVDELIRQHGRPTETMSLDHVAILAKIEAFKSCVDKLLSSQDPHERGNALTCLKRVTHQLDALLTVHLRKEEEGLLPFLDRYRSQEEVDAIIHKMHE